MNKNTTEYLKARPWIVLGAFLCAAYVGLSAWGAHGLSKSLSASELNTYETGLRYLVLNSLGMILINVVFIILQKYHKWTNFFMLAGFLFFSAGLMIHATREMLGFSIDIFNKTAPVGGLCYMAAWLIFAFRVSKK